MRSAKDAGDGDNVELQTSLLADGAEAKDVAAPGGATAPTTGGYAPAPNYGGAAAPNYGGAAAPNYGGAAAPNYGDVPSYSGAAPTADASGSYPRGRDRFQSVFTPALSLTSIGDNVTKVIPNNGFQARCNAVREETAQRLQALLPPAAQVRATLLPDETLLSDDMIVERVTMAELGNQGTCLSDEHITAQLTWTNRRLIICRSFQLSHSDVTMTSAPPHAPVASAVITASKQTKFMYMTVPYTLMSNVKIDSATGTHVTVAATLRRRPWVLLVTAAITFLLAIGAAAVGYLYTYQEDRTILYPLAIAVLAVGAGITGMLVYFQWRATHIGLPVLMNDDTKSIAITLLDPQTWKPAVLTLRLTSLPDVTAASPHSEWALTRWVQALHSVAPHLADGSRAHSVVPLFKLN